MSVDKTRLLASNLQSACLLSSLFSLSHEFCSHISHWNEWNLLLLGVRRVLVMWPVGLNEILCSVFLSICLEIFHIKWILRLPMLILFYVFNDKDRFKIGSNKLAVTPKINASKHLSIFNCFTMQMFSSPSFMFLPWGSYIVPSGVYDPLNLISSLVQTKPLMVYKLFQSY